MQPNRIPLNGQNFKPSNINFSEMGCPTEKNLGSKCSGKKDLKGYEII